MRCAIQRLNNISSKMNRNSDKTHFICNLNKQFFAHHSLGSAKRFKNCVRIFKTIVTAELFQIPFFCLRIYTSPVLKVRQLEWERTRDYDHVSSRRLKIWKPTVR